MDKNSQCSTKTRKDSESCSKDQSKNKSKAQDCQ